MKLEEAQVQLNYITHDARTILKLLGVKRLNIWWQLRLMEACYNYSDTSVTTIIKDIANRPDNQGKPFDQILRICMPLVYKRRNHASANFTDKAALNLLTFDRLVVAADYSVRLDNLAEILNDLGEEESNEIANDINGCGMNLLIIKLEEYRNGRNKMMNDMAKAMDISLPPIVPSTQQGKEKMDSLLEDLKHMRNK